MIYGAKLYPVRQGHNLAEAIPALKKAGFGFFEICLEELTPEVLTQLRQLKKFDWLKIGLHFPCPGSPVAAGPALCDSSPETRKKIDFWLRKANELAEEFNIKTLVIHASGRSSTAPQANRGEAVKITAENIRYILANTNLTLLLENLVNKFGICLSPEELIAVIKKVNDPRLKACFDIAHAWAAGYKKEQEVTAYLEKIYPYLGYFHMSDSISQKIDDHIEIGTGKIDFGIMMRFLKKKGYHDKIILEIFVPDWEAQIRSKDYVEGLLKKL